jgi:hypothetical protein
MYIFFTGISPSGKAVNVGSGGPARNWNLGNGALPTGQAPGAMNGVGGRESTDAA